MATERSICTKLFALNNGCFLPAVGLGTFQGVFGSDDEEPLVESIIHALRSGYRLIDTGSIYGTENAVGKAVRACGIPRNEIIVVTKLWNNFHSDPEQALQQSLLNLHLEYIDIFMMHWPQATTRDMKPLRIDESPTYLETWKLMEKLVGPRCRGIGVSNFSQKLLERLLREAEIVPAAGGILSIKGNPRDGLEASILPDKWREATFGLTTCNASRTIGGMGSTHDVLTHDLFTKIARTHNCSTAIISLSWAVQRGITVVPKSSQRSRIEDNIQLVTLSNGEMEEINCSHKNITSYRIADYIPQLQIEINGIKTIQGWTKAELGWEDENGNWLT